MPALIFSHLYCSCLLFPSKYSWLSFNLPFLSYIVLFYLRFLFLACIVSSEFLSLPPFFEVLLFKSWVWPIFLLSIPLCGVASFLSLRTEGFVVFAVRVRLFLFFYTFRYCVHLAKVLSLIQCASLQFLFLVAIDSFLLVWFLDLFPSVLYFNLSVFRIVLVDIHSAACLVSLPASDLFAN